MDGAPPSGLARSKTKLPFSRPEGVSHQAGPDCGKTKQKGVLAPCFTGKCPKQDRPTEETYRPQRAWKKSGRPPIGTRSRDLLFARTTFPRGLIACQGHWRGTSRAGQPGRRQTLFNFLLQLVVTDQQAGDVRTNDPGLITH